MNKSFVFYFIGTIGMLAIFSSTLSKSPVLPLFAKYLAKSLYEEQFIGIVIAASTIPGILISAIAGHLSDIYGREKLLLLSAIVFASAPFFYIFATNIWILMLVRFYHGFATAIFMPVAMAAIAEIYPQEKGEKISLFSSLTLIGRFFAPLTGGVILYLSSNNYYGVYIVCGISGFFTLLISIVCFRQISTNKNIHRVQDSQQQLFTFNTFLHELYAIYHNRLNLSTSIVQGAQYFAYGTVEAYIILYASDLLYPTWLIGIIPSVLILILFLGKPLMGKLSDQRGRRAFILGGVLIGAITTALIPYISNPMLLLCIIAGVGLGMAIVASSTVAYIADNISSKQYGTGIGALSTIMDVGQTMGPIISGFLLVCFSFQGVFTMAAIVLLVGAIVFGIYGNAPKPTDIKVRAI